jgi:hypothetical protein
MAHHEAKFQNNETNRDLRMFPALVYGENQFIIPEQYNSSEPL